MATLIDALVVTLGLDANHFRNEAEKIKKENKKLTEEQERQVERLKKQGIQALGVINSVQKGITGFIIAAAGASGLTDFLNKVNQAEASLGKLSTQTGQSTQDLHKWGNVAELVGGKAEDMQVGMANLQKQMTDLKYKGEMGGMLVFLSQMGVAVADTNGKMRSQNDIMLDLADRAKNMSKEDFHNLASGAGFTESQILAMSKGRAELSKLLAEQEKNALITKEQAEQAQKLNAQWSKIKQSFFSLGVRILSDIAPTVEYLLSLIADFFEFLQQHRAVAYAVFGGFAAALAPAILSTIRFIGLLVKGWLPAFRLILSISGMLLNVLRGIAAVMLAAASPVLAVVAGIAALAAAIYLLWDDWKTWRDGGDSLIDWDSWSQEIDWAVDGITRLIQSLGKLGGAVDAIKKGDFKGAWNIIKSTVVDAFNQPKEKDVTPAKPAPVNTPLLQSTKDYIAKLQAENQPQAQGVPPLLARPKADSEIRDKVTKMVDGATTALSAIGTVIGGTAKLAGEVQ